MSGALCGGVISESQMRKAMNIDVWACAMEIVLPDDKFKEWTKLRKQGKSKEAEKLIKKYGRSQI